MGTPLRIRISSLPQIGLQLERKPPIGLVCRTSGWFTADLAVGLPRIGLRYRGTGISFLTGFWYALGLSATLRGTKIYVSH